MATLVSFPVMRVTLTDKNLLLYAAKNYLNTQCNDMDEFYDDLLIPIHIKKLLSRYNNTGQLKERLIINHLISFFNVFYHKAALKILFFKIDKELHPILKTFLVYLDRCPDIIENLYDTPYNVKDIEINLEIMKTLTKNLDK